MSLPVYDSTKHHIGLAPVGDPLQGLIIAGGYTRSPQRYGASPKYGGEQDQLEPSALSRWTQDDFSGGAFKEDFGKDVAMFARSTNFLPSLVEDSARTAPPLVRFVGAGQVAADTAIAVMATGGKQIAVVDSDRVRFYDAVVGTKVEQVDPTHTIKAAAHDPADNRVYLITLRNTDSRPHLRRVKKDELVDLAAFPDTAPLACRGMIVTSGRDILAAMGTTLYLCDVNDARDDATFTRVGRLPGLWQDAVTYNGQTYILLTDGEQQTQVVSWDGTQILPVTDVPYNFLGSCIGVYGGRLYVGGRGRDLETDGDAYAELYEITGASLRLVKTFSSEARLGQTCPTNIFSMAVHEGLLFCGTDQGELLAYDLTRDALWPGIEIFSASGHTLEARYLLSTRQRLVAWCYDKNRTADEDGFYRMAPTDADLDGTNGDPDATPFTSFVETSDFAPEPEREKRWSQLRVLTRYSPAPTLEYSVDGGATWASLASTSTAGSAGLVKTDYSLAGVDASESIRFRFSFSKDTVAWTELIAFTCSFIMLDSGKQAWSFSLLGAEYAENLDGSYPEQDVLALRTALWGYWEDKTTLTYRDQDGTDRTVFLSDLNETQPVIGEALDENGTREAFFSVTLTEL